MLKSPVFFPVISSLQHLTHELHIEQINGGACTSEIVCKNYLIILTLTKSADTGHILSPLLGFPVVNAKDYAF